MRKSVIQHVAVSLGLLSVMLLTGCASRTPLNYYTLKPVDNPQALATSHSIGIQPVVIPSWLDQNKFSWNDGGVNMVVLGQDRWASPLSTMVNQVMLRNFSRIYPDSLISIGPWVRSDTPDRVVAVRMMALERANNALSTEIAVTIFDQKRKVLSNSFRTYRQPLTDNSSASGFAEALGHILATMNTEIALQLR